MGGRFGPDQKGAPLEVTMSSGKLKRSCAEGKGRILGAEYSILRSGAHLQYSIVVQLLEAKPRPRDAFLQRDRLLPEV